MGAVPVVAEQGLAGAYLAARQATLESDYAAAIGFYAKALEYDSSNAELLEGAIISQMGIGNLDAAVPMARRLRGVVQQSAIAELVLAADQLKRGDFAGLLADYDAGRQIGPLVDGLVIAWANFAQGNVSDAMEAFDKVSAMQALAPFGNYHKALALALVGDFEAAEALFSQVETGGTQLTRRGIIAHAEVLGQLGRNTDALALIERFFGGDPDPEIVALRSALLSDAAPPFTAVNDPMDGLGEVFFSVATVLNGEAEDTFTLLYSRTSEILVPDHTEAILLSAEILERQGQHDLATTAYNRIPRTDPAFHMAELGRAEALRALGKNEAAIEVLEQLAKSNPTLPGVHRALGDFLREQERYPEATLAYDAAIAALPEEDPSHWVLYYARGITYERSDRWTEAQADFRKALELDPDQPSVLNYLGYSFLEHGENLDEALSMIERAVAARPDDGYIIDSLGWAFYLMGRYDEAVEPMERAAALMAVDPVVNDHLGDVFWAVGRHTEAEFQWHRALSFDPEEKDAARIRLKLERGLDAVLAGEGAKPLDVANDNGG
jgi:tetratricopeptide (TPR) repeat protein